MTTPRTVEELRAALAAMGRPADAIGRDEDPGARRDEDALLVRRLADRQVALVLRGRGVDRSVTTYPDEAAAVEAAAHSLLAPAPAVRTRTAEERAHDKERMRKRAAEELAHMQRVADGKTSGE